MATSNLLEDNSTILNILIRKYSEKHRSDVMSHYEKLVQKACTPVATRNDRFRLLPIELQLEVLEQLDLHEAHKLVIDVHPHLLERWVYGLKLQREGPRWHHDLTERNNFQYLGLCGLQDSFRPSYAYIFRLRSLNFHPDLQLLNMGWQECLIGEHSAPDLGHAKTYLDDKLLQLCWWHNEHHDLLWNTSMASEMVWRPADRLATYWKFQGPLPNNTAQAMLIPLEKERQIFREPPPQIIYDGHWATLSAKLLLFEDEIDVLAKSLSVLVPIDLFDWALSPTFPEEELMRLHDCVIRGDAVARVCQNIS